jgi:N-acetylmuramoyl-L-alanine amidase
MPLSLPRGRVERIYLHWSAGDYTTVFPSYHVCVALREGIPAVEMTHDLRANMRDVHDAEAGTYAAHTAGRNSYAAGLSVMGMRDATPSDFGAYPITPEQIDAMCAVAAEIARAYDIAIDAGHVCSHAEAAIVDGYFGIADDERWDIVRLVASSALPTPQEAIATGDVLRSRIRKL